MKNVLITGGGGGIGEGLAYAFGKAGYRVCLHYNKSEEKAAEIKESLVKAGCDCEIFKADLTKDEEIQELFSSINSFCGGIDILINNAGVSYIGLLSDTALEKIDELLSVNTRAPILCCKYGTEKMLRNKWGRVINISSMWGVCGASCETVYSASKAAVIGFTKALAKELAPSGITVNCIAPGFIDTKMNGSLSEADRNALVDETPAGRIGTADDVANAALFFASDRSDFITGQTLTTDGGLTL